MQFSTSLGEEGGREDVGREKGRNKYFWEGGRGYFPPVAMSSCFCNVLCTCLCNVCTCGKHSIFRYDIIKPHLHHACTVFIA